MSSSDWTEIFETAGTVDDSPVPAGTYLTKVERTEWTKSSTGKKMLKYRFRIISGPQKNKVVFGNLTISPDSPVSLSITLRHLAALGMGRDQLQSMTDTEVCESVIGNEVIVDTELKEYKGKPSVDVKDIRPAADTPAVVSAPSAGGPPPKPFAS